MKRFGIILFLALFLPALCFGWQSKAVKKAKDFLSANMISDAIQVLENGIHEKPKDLEAHWLLGKLYLERGSYSSAEERFNSAVLLKPGYKDELGKVYKEVADIALGQGDLHKVRTLHGLAANQDRSVSAQIEKDVWALGEAVFNRGRIQESEKLFDALVALNASYKDRVSDLYFTKEHFGLASKYSSKHNSEIHALYVAKMKASASVQGYNEWREKALKYGDVIDYKVYGPGDAPGFPLEKGNETAHFIRLATETTCEFVSFVHEDQYELRFRDGRTVKIWAGEELPDNLPDFRIYAKDELIVKIVIKPYLP